MLALAMGNRVVMIADGIRDALTEFNRAGLPVTGAEGSLNPQVLGQVTGIDGVMTQADLQTKRDYRQALAGREGMLIPLITGTNAAERLIIERHLCIDTTAAGGNASLIAAGG
jgi:RHH-type proline utilization regulon transcriptional repressor/proline dehydrogenase/delta 1-pyrroline-5-carboxylate dehydrogenase